MKGKVHHPGQRNRILYLKVKGLNGLPVLVVGELAKKHPLLLQVFIKSLKRVKEGGKTRPLDMHPGTRGGASSLPVPTVPLLPWERQGA